MKNFYTFSDKREKYFHLYKISSIETYVNLISNIDLSTASLKAESSINGDYEFIQDIIENQIQSAERVVLMGVFDLSKEAFFINKFLKKKFLLCDVSTEFLKKIQNDFKNIEILETSLQNFIPNKNDLIITNLSEYFLNKKEIIRFISGGGNIILNNVSIIERHPFFFFYETINFIKIHLVNILSIIVPIRQYKFRGYIRTINDYNLIANRASKKLSNYTFNEKKTIKYKFSTMKYAMILFTKKEI